MQVILDFFSWCVDSSWVKKYKLSVHWKYEQGEAVMDDPAHVYDSTVH